MKHVRLPIVATWVGEAMQSGMLDVLEGIERIIALKVEFTDGL